LQSCSAIYSSWHAAEEESQFVDHPAAADGTAAAAAVEESQCVVCLDPTATTCGHQCLRDDAECLGAIQKAGECPICNAAVNELLETERRRPRCIGRGSVCTRAEVPLDTTFVSPPTETAARESSTRCHLSEFVYVDRHARIVYGSALWWVNFS
jgi:hypothetical protein